MGIITGLVDSSVNIGMLINEWGFWFPEDNSLVEGFSSASLEALDEIEKEVAKLSFGGGIEAVTFQGPEEAQDARDSRYEIWPHNYLLDWDCALRVTPTEELLYDLKKDLQNRRLASLRMGVANVVEAAIHRSLGPYLVTVSVYVRGLYGGIWWLDCTISIGDTKKTPRLTGV